jgi:hypothetical protein
MGQQNRRAIRKGCSFLGILTDRNGYVFLSMRRVFPGVLHFVRGTINNVSIPPENPYF